MVIRRAYKGGGGDGWICMCVCVYNRYIYMYTHVLAGYMLDCVTYSTRVVAAVTLELVVLVVGI